MKINIFSITYLFLMVVWFMNINDLIRGKWFYNSIASIIFFNVFGILAFISIIMDYKSKTKKPNQGGYEDVRCKKTLFINEIIRS